MQTKILISVLYLILLLSITVTKVEANTSDGLHYNVHLLPFSSKNDTDLWSDINKNSLLVNKKDKVLNNSADLILRANSEYSNILAILQNHGYFGSHISITLNGTEVHEIDTSTMLPGYNDIQISIKPGNIYHISRITLKGISDQTSIPIKPGDIAKASNLKKIPVAALKDLFKEGYADAKISSEITTANDKNQSVDYSLTICRNAKVHLQDVNIINSSEHPYIDSEYIKFLSGFVKGSLVTPDLINKYQDNLERLDIFNNVLISHTTYDKAGNAILNIVVIEKARHNFSAGVSYDSKNGPGGDISWMHRNLTGYGDHLTISAGANAISINKKHYSRAITTTKLPFDYKVNILYDRPGFTNFITHGVVGAHAIREHNKYYDSKDVGAKLGSYRLIYNNWLGSSYFAFSKIMDSSIIFGRRDFKIIELDNGITIDTRDSTLEPHKGSFTCIKLDPFYDLIRHHLDTTFEVEKRIYIAFDPHANYILALRGKYGGIFGGSLQSIPFSRQYFAGGDSNLRGYSYRSVGLPVYLDNNAESALGGCSMELLSAELRANITGPFSMVAFVDHAAIGSNLLPKDTSKVGIGAGIRYNSPLGPIRLDIAAPLHRKKDESCMQLYIGIGESF